MRRVYILLFCILFVGLITKPCFSEEIKEIDGYMWESWDDSTKLGWALGFSEGVNQAEMESSGPLETLGIIVKETFKKGAPAIKEWVDKTADLPRKRLDLSGITFGQIVEGLDKFYKDYRNMTVLVRKAIWIVKLEMRGAPQEFIDEETRILRMPTEEWVKEWLNLVEKNQAYKGLWKKWGDQIPYALPQLIEIPREMIE